ncbi:Titin like [Heracleum sosnowskyi]|uniref:Titin like n=1 Tax=Heracleum sosnowskyi TaxID=360622 RepID=A0AAD8MVD4_9APIA|nr:Titin like [Heracleum sosnowskyi]
MLLTSWPLSENDHLLSRKINKSGSFAFVKQNLHLQVSCRPICSTSDGFVCLCTQQPHSIPQIVGNEQQETQEEDEDEEYVQILRVPQDWLNPSKALEEATWLRTTLHKWLDDEYCPEATNVEISKVAADSYHKSLLEKESDLGEILLKMAMDLGSVSFQESFHGAFSSANAAVNLIVQRIEQN